MTEATLLGSILKELQHIGAKLEENQTDYIDSDGAANIIGLANTRNLKQLAEMGYLKRYQRAGSTYVYKKSECHKVAALLDAGHIKLKAASRLKD